MADNVETSIPRISEEEARYIFETLHIGTQEQRTGIVGRSRKQKQAMPSRSYSLRLSYSSGSATDGR